MAHVRGEATVNIAAKFRFEEIDDFVECFDLTPVHYQEIANILTANLEVYKEREDGTVAIERSNFNDSFFDMQDDLQEQYDRKTKINCLIVRNKALWSL